MKTTTTTSKSNVSIHSRLTKIAVVAAILGAVVLIGVLLWAGLVRNYAAEVAGPLEQDLAGSGGVKQYAELALY